MQIINIWIFIFSLFISLPLLASNLVVMDEQNASVDGKIFKNNYNKLKKLKDITRLKYEDNNLFLERRHKAVNNFRNLISKNYFFTFNGIYVKYDWSSSLITYVIESSIPLNMPKSDGSSTEVMISHIINDELGQEIVAFPNFLSISMQTKMTEFGYADVISYQVIYTNKEVYKK